ncbi:hypothetical protein K502DRAFT_351445, partial [Neoconidiobolus thromboides FSU 785]
PKQIIKNQIMEAQFTRTLFTVLGINSFIALATPVLSGDSIQKVAIPNKQSGNHQFVGRRGSGRIYNIRDVDRAYG